MIKLDNCIISICTLFWHPPPAQVLKCHHICLNLHLLWPNVAIRCFSIYQFWFYLKKICDFYWTFTIISDMKKLKDVFEIIQNEIPNGQFLNYEMVCMGYRVSQHSFFLKKNDYPIFEFLGLKVRVSCLIHTADGKRNVKSSRSTRAAIPAELCHKGSPNHDLSLGMCAL